MQLQQVRGDTHRNKVAVGEFSYHGPSTSSSAVRPRPWESVRIKSHIQFQLCSPHRDVSNQKQVEAEAKDKFHQWLDTVMKSPMLVEPQWGSSVAAQPWSPEKLLRHVIREAQDRGILVCADEIMCGLFRHGKGTMFLSEAWNLNVDAVTFGKSVACGMFPLSKRDSLERCI